MSAYRRLGEHLIAAGRLSPSQLESALDLQRREGGRLGEILVAQGLVRELDVAESLGSQYGCPVVGLEGAAAPGQGLAELATPEFAVEHQVLPWELEPEAKRLTVLVADPVDFAATDELSRSTGLRVQIAVAPPAKLRRAILAAYGLAPPEAPRLVERRKRPSAADQSDRSALLQLWSGGSDDAAEAAA